VRNAVESEKILAGADHVVIAQPIALGWRQQARRGGLLI
jgi:hypothetical protein